MGQRGPAGLLDAVKKKEICAILASGGSQADAAGYVGCSPGTISNTAKRDPAFADEMHRARAMCTADCLAQIHQAGAKSWRAAAWILERTRPEQYEKINLRQASTKQLGGFWRTCGDELLAGLPPEQQDLLQKRFKQVVKSYASRAFETFGMEQEEDDFKSEILDFREAAEDATHGGLEPAPLPVETLRAEDMQGEELIAEDLNAKKVIAALSDSEILNPEICDSELRTDRLIPAPSANLWPAAAAAVLLVAAMLWGSFARSAEIAPSARRVRGLACSASSTTRTSCQDQTSTPARACRVLNRNIERFPPNASRFAFKVSPVAAWLSPCC